MAGIHKKNWWIFASFLAGTLIGSGSIWQYKNLQISKRSHEIESVLKIAEIRNKVGLLQQEIIVMTEEYVSLLRSDRENPNPSTNNKILHLRSRLTVVKDDFSNLEAELAKLENRVPRRIQIDFVPPKPPTNLRVE